MSGKNTAVFGIYPHQTSVESGVQALRAAGFSIAALLTDPRALCTPAPGDPDAQRDLRRGGNHINAAFRSCRAATR